MSIENGQSIIKNVFKRVTKMQGTIIKVETGDLVIASIEYIPKKYVSNTDNALDVYRTMLEHDMIAPQFTLQDTQLQKIKKFDRLKLMQTQYPLCLIYSNNKPISVLNKGYGKEEYDIDKHAAKFTDYGITCIQIGNKMMKSMNLVMVYGMSTKGEFIKLNGDKEVSKYLESCIAETDSEYTSSIVNGMQSEYTKLFNPKLYKTRVDSTNYKLNKVKFTYNS